jgi:hypothetical protein
MRTSLVTIIMLVTPLPAHAMFKGFGDPEYLGQPSIFQMPTTASPSPACYLQETGNGKFSYTIEVCDEPVSNAEPDHDDYDNDLDNRPYR